MAALYFSLRNYSVNVDCIYTQLLVKMSEKRKQIEVFRRLLEFGLKYKMKMGFRFNFTEAKLDFNFSTKRKKKKQKRVIARTPRNAWEQMLPNRNRRHLKSKIIFFKLLEEAAVDL